MEVSCKSVACQLVLTHDRTIELILTITDHFLEAEKIIAFPAGLLRRSAWSVVVNDLIQHFRNL